MFRETQYRSLLVRVMQVLHSSCVQYVQRTAACLKENVYGHGLCNLQS